VSQKLIFSDSRIIQGINLRNQLTKINFSEETYLTLKIEKNKIKSRPLDEADCQLVFYDKNITVGVILWPAEREVPHTILKLQSGKYRACSLASLKEFLMTRSDFFKEWLLWNLC
jgi:hypothetical protein